MSKKNILMISYYFAPENKIGAIRFSKFAKYLNQNNYDLTIICASENEKIDPTLENDIEDIKKIHRIMSSAIYNKLNMVFSKRKDNIVAKNAHVKGEDNNTIKSRIYLKTRIIYGNLMRRLMDYFIAKETIKYLKMNSIILENIDVVFSTYGPLCNHIVAKWIKKKNNSIKWIADFRDGIKNGIFSEDSIKSVKVEQNICANANAVTIVAEGCVSDGIKEEYFEKIKEIPNGYDRDDLMTFDLDKDCNISCERLQIAYTGMMYTKKDRDASLLFYAIRQLIDEGYCEKHNIEVVYAGNDFPVFLAQASTYGLEDILIDYGYVNREKSIRIQKNADILLHLTAYNNPSIDLLSGKLFEYIAMDKPIISIVIGRLTGSRVKRIIDEAKLGVCCEASNPCNFEILKKFIYEKYTEKMDTGEVKSVSDKQYIRKYDYKYLTERLINIIEE